MANESNAAHYYPSMNTNNRNVIIGPMNAGKTLLLSVLQLAAGTGAYDSSLNEISVRPSSGEDPITRLFQSARTALIRGEIPIDATADTVDFNFEIGLRPKRKGILGKIIANIVGQESTQQFSMLDGPGGTLFQSSKNTKSAEVDTAELTRYREEQLQRIREATGIIICVDPTDNDAAMTFFLDLPRFLADLNVRHLSAQRISFALTKADRQYGERDVNAERKLRQTCPAESLTRLLGRQNLRMLRTYLPNNTEVACCWTSVFGFTTKGAPNFDRQTNGLAVRANDEAISAVEALDEWRPHQVLEPFLYLSGGQKINMIPVPLN
ncbi:hypothetical protein [Rhodospirillum sp. A1_3_36]|uniref:hypothetical protein n=1 Tax=Rhodospirillum sp. A1_3_36 TaxID=3391666 RepID=UPI0039A6185B